MEKRHKGKYDEDLSDLPERSALCEKAPVLDMCEVCGQASQVIEGAVYQKFKIPPAKDGDPWGTDHAYDYAKVVLKPSKMHQHCERIRKLETANLMVVEQLVQVRSDVAERRRPRSIVAKLRHRAGVYLHRLGELVQR